MAAIITKFTRILSEEGVGGVVRRLGRALWSRRRMVFMERDLSLDDEVPFLPRQPFVMRLIEGEADLGLIAPHVIPERLAEYRRRLALGMKGCFAISADERECNGWVWTTDRAYFEPFDNATYRAMPDSFYYVDGEVVGDRRGRGVAFTAFPLLWPYWRSRGFHRCHCAIDVTNRPSLKVHERLGYQRRNIITIHTALGFKWMTPSGTRVGPGDETGRE